MTTPKPIGTDQRWAQLRFAIVGPLLAAPRPPGELRLAFERLAQETWLHPQDGRPVRFAASTIERWYYTARADADPVRRLARKRRRDHGSRPSIAPALATAIAVQYRAHPSWSYQLHRDNLVAAATADPSLGAVPSYPSVRRYMVANGMVRQPKKRRAERAGEQRAAIHTASHEVRSYEAEYAHQLWHLDFHHGSRKVLLPDGQWVRPLLLAILDDCTRWVCHAQWYLEETARCLVHGLLQAFMKQGLPRGLLRDNGGAMIAAETVQGLRRLSILDHTTLPYSPHQNGKQEVFWGQVEGRLLAMLDGEPTLTLELLNRATQAWVAQEYHRKIHRELAMSPLERLLGATSVGRQAPDVDDLRWAFTQATTRRQRRSDGTISLMGCRYEVPSRLRHVPTLALRYASWDKTQVVLVDAATGTLLERIRPLDRQKNADGVRRALASAATSPIPREPPAGIAPLLQRLMADYAATGLPPAYLPEETP